jgi:hypothetical protein
MSKTFNKYVWQPTKEQTHGVWADGLRDERRNTNSSFLRPLNKTFKANYSYSSVRTAQ